MNHAQTRRVCGTIAAIAFFICGHVTFARTVPLTSMSHFGVISGAFDNSEAGSSVVASGDFDGDGFKDMIIDSQHDSFVADRGGSLSVFLWER
jgi:hypothetical protein